MPNQQNPSASLLGSIVTFGPWNWRIMDVQNRNGLLLSDKIVEIRAYHSDYDDITWAECALRHYLNGPFLHHFSADDKSRIVETATCTHCNPWYGTAGGSVSKDRVFLLSIEEAVHYFGDSGALQKGPPEEEGMIGCIDDASNLLRIAYDDMGDACAWWLRSPGKYSSYAALISDDGEVNLYGPFDDDTFAFGAGIRPALWLRLD